jgi:hypothetical protein
MSRSSQFRYGPCGPSWSGLRRAPLRRLTPLRSRLVMVPVDVRLAVEVRSGGVCEVARRGCLGAAREVHHRLARGSGGRRGSARLVSDSLANLLHVCRLCHDWSHLHPASAREAEWLLGGREVPAQLPLVYRGEPAFLDDLGGVHAFDLAGA